jgi:hypothetical protein
VVLGIVACAFACVAPIAAADVPLAQAQDVYRDFIDNGRLDHTYPRSLLRAILADTRLNEYGDPLQMILLRRAIRLQLAGVHPGDDSRHQEQPTGPAALRAAASQNQELTSRSPLLPLVDATRAGSHANAGEDIRVEGASAPFTNTQVALLGAPFALVVGGLLFARTRTRRSKE